MMRTLIRRVNNTTLILCTTMIFAISFISCSGKKDNPLGSTEDNNPAITSFTPARGIPGTIITLTGKNFGSRAADNKIRFAGGNVDAEITFASTTELKVKVPASAATGKITLTVGRETVNTATDFTVDPVPASITSFTPKQGAFGTVVTITGVNFADAKVSINNIEAVIKKQSTTEIEFEIPVDTRLSSHKISVQSGAAILETAENFTVTATGPYATWRNKDIKFIVQPDAGAFNFGLSFVQNNKIYWGFSKMFFNSTTIEYAVYDPSATQTGSWTDLKSIPATVLQPDLQNMKALVQDNRAFMGTGLTANSTRTDKWWEFHPSTNTLTEKTPYPKQTHNAIGFLIANKMFLGFGSVNQELYSFDPAGINPQGTWIKYPTNAPFQELNTGGAVNLNNVAYMGRALPAPGQDRKAFYKFTEATGFSRVNDMPEEQTSLQTPAFTIAGNKGYFIIGKKVWEYTPDATGGTWRVVLADPNAPTIIQTALLEVNGIRVVYGWTSSGWIYEFRI